MSDKTDIVYRLRHDCMSLIADEAADVIERLRKELDARIAMCDMRSEKIIELTAERNEARREVCELRTDIGFSRPIATHMNEFATSRGWDCFKENTNG